MELISLLNMSGCQIGPAEADAPDFLGDLTLAEKFDNMPESESITGKKGHKKD